jgi:hypothetical protein
MLRTSIDLFQHCACLPAFFKFRQGCDSTLLPPKRIEFFLLPRGLLLRPIPCRISRHGLNSPNARRDRLFPHDPE